MQITAEVQTVVRPMSWVSNLIEMYQYSHFEIQLLDDMYRSVKMNFGLYREGLIQTCVIGQGTY